MMHGVMGDDAFRFVVVVASSIQIAIEPRKVAARDLDAQAMSGGHEWVDGWYTYFCAEFPVTRVPDGWMYNSALVLRDGQRAIPGSRIPPS